MSERTLSALIAAMQLLLNDMEPVDRAFVILEAFPDMIVLAKGNQAEDFLKRLRTAELHSRIAKNIADGSSGLGHHAAKNVANNIALAQQKMADVLRILRAEPYA